MGSAWFQTYHRNLQRVLFATLIDDLGGDRRAAAHTRSDGDAAQPTARGHGGDAAANSPIGEAWPGACLAAGMTQGAL
jgi:hypothetical protein